MENNWIKKQQLLCKQLQVTFLQVMNEEILGVATENIKNKSLELHGLRHPAEGQTTGWFIWRGEYREDDNFFKPMHVLHLLEIAPEAIKFLGLPPGWRFLKKFTYEDVWYDPQLLSISEEDEE